EVETPEFLVAGDVGERLACGAARDESVEIFQLLPRDAGEVSSEARRRRRRTRPLHHSPALRFVEWFPSPASRGRSFSLCKLPQQPRIEPRVVDAGGAQPDHGLLARHPSSSIAERRSAWSCATSASTMSPRSSPETMRSSLYSVRLMRWSVTRPCGKLYVRMRSERSPEPTIDLRSLARALSRRARSMSYSLAFSSFIAAALFLCCDFSVCCATAMPVGRWVMRTALSVLLTCWPPAPWAR